MRRIFPSLADVPLAATWGGPIDVSGDRLPAIGLRAGGRVLYAHGYSGNGVGPAQLAGRILASLLVTPDAPLSRLPIVGRRPRRFPPEPLRFAGARAIREALIRVDDAAEEGRRPNLLVRQLAALPRRLGYRMGPRGPHRS